MTESEQDRADRDWAQYHADMQAFEKEAHDALKASLVRPLTPDEVAAIAWVAHIPTP